jgi:hypothetical protein
MKSKTFLILSFVLIIALQGFSQRRIELTPMAGYQFGGSVHYTEGKFKIDDNAVFGGILGVEIRPNLVGEFSYSYMGTKGTFTPYSNYALEPQTYNMNVQYYQLGIEKEFGKQQFKGFGLFSMGATWFDFTNDANVSDAVKFSVGLGLGAKIMFTKVVGIRVQGRLLLPMNFAGGGAYVGVGTGGTTGGFYVSSWSAIVEGDFTGGLIFMLGKK